MAVLVDAALELPKAQSAFGQSSDEHQQREDLERVVIRRVTCELGDKEYRESSHEDSGRA
jgi:hypothetical protein